MFERCRPHQAGLFPGRAFSPGGISIVNLGLLSTLTLGMVRFFYM